MYYESYDEYMRNQTNSQNMVNPYLNGNMMPTYTNQYNYTNPNQLANNLYPKLYQEMTQKIDNMSDYRLTEENVEKITEKLYEDYKGSIPETKDPNQINFIKDLIRIIVIKYLLSKQRPRSPYQPIPNQMPFYGYMGYQY